MSKYYLNFLHNSLLHKDIIRKNFNQTIPNDDYLSCMKCNFQHFPFNKHFSLYKNIISYKFTNYNGNYRKSSNQNQKNTNSGHFHHRVLKLSFGVNWNFVKLRIKKQITFFAEFSIHVRRTKWILFKNSLDFYV